MTELLRTKKEISTIDNKRIETMMLNYKEIFGGGIKMSNKYLSSGLDDLDEMLKGGYIVGECTEITGISNSGKTLLAVNAINQLPNDLLTIYIDTSLKLNESIFLDNNIDKDSVIIIRENNAIELVNILKTLSQLKDYIGLIIIDDLASLTTTHELSCSIQKNTDIHRSKIIKGLLMRINNLIYETNITCLIINQLRGNYIGDNCLEDTVSSFENLIKLSCSTRIKLSLDENNELFVDITFKEKKIK